MFMLNKSFSFKVILCVSIFFFKIGKGHTLDSTEYKNFCKRGAITRIVVTKTYSKFCDMVNVKKLNAIKKIHFSHPRTLKNLPPASFEGLSGLQEISFSGISGELINKEIFKNMNDLRKVSFHRYFESEVPLKIINSIPGVKELSISDSGTLKFNKGFFSRPSFKNSLRKISFHRNKEVVFGKGSYSGLEQLESLAFNQNRKVVLEDSLSKLKGLVELLSNGRGGLKNSHKSDLLTLSKLKRLEISGNDLSKLTGEDLSKLSSLEKLILRQFSKFELKPEMFVGNKNLKWLDLSANKIKKISNFTFKGLNKLEHLSLNSNKLTEIEKDAFRGIKKLRSLSLKYNKISHIENGAFYKLGLENLEHGVIELEGNPVKSKITTDVMLGDDNIDYFDYIKKGIIYFGRIDGKIANSFLGKEFYILTDKGPVNTKANKVIKNDIGEYFLKLDKDLIGSVAFSHKPNIKESKKTYYKKLLKNEVKSLVEDLKLSPIGGNFVEKNYNYGSQYDPQGDWKLIGLNLIYKNKIIKKLPWLELYDHGISEFFNIDGKEYILIKRYGPEAEVETRLYRIDFDKHHLIPVRRRITPEYVPGGYQC